MDTNNIIHSAIELINDSSSDDSDLWTDSSDEELLLLNDVEHRQVPKVENFCGIIFRMHEKTFQSHFRLTRGSFEIVRRAIGPMLEPKNKEGGHPNVPLEKAILSTIWLLSNQDSFREVSNLFDLSSSTTHKIFLNICGALCKIVNEYLHWPNLAEFQNKKQQFNNLRGPNDFPDVVCAVDGMHIEIPAPNVDPKSYYNRKGFHSIILQGICDAKCQFIDIFIGWPGATHDARVWRESPIGQALAEDPTLIPEGTHILGDSAYSLQPYLLTPFRDNGHLSRRQKLYNAKLSSKRVVIEQAFGRLRSRFRRLKFLNMSLINEMKIVVVAVCVLHNICIRNNDETELSNKQHCSNITAILQHCRNVLCLLGGICDICNYFITYT
ncbi:putative nuclease HARBI1 isoform X1 [Monomorium pharaonis]|uniref:putative nuclease HARBI1 isoform X1 n=2 Tax=Monomorium pharaonis TaxID=307658 RepID=UPI001745E5D9|nr:putative nuclease HARBI1 isoform X1 [Monomorium pharaonis]XP_036144257.1 putative nuclease HARBI1 isoform X1 [Monomorium pharaonis]